MIVTIGALLTVLVTSFVVIPRGKGKNETSLPAQLIKHSPKKKLLSTIAIKQETINQAEAQAWVSLEDYQVETGL
jgi:hypothetical protein